jgi:Zn-dependent metalloprotease
MKNKKRKEKLLKRAIKLRLKIIEEKKDIDDKVTVVNQSIIKRMKALGIKSYEHLGGTVRVMQMDRDVWDEEALYKFLRKKIDIQSANEAVKKEYTRKVDDDVVLRLIQEKRITLTQVKKFVHVKSGVPFVKIF